MQLHCNTNPLDCLPENSSSSPAPVWPDILQDRNGRGKQRPWSQHKQEAATLADVYQYMSATAGEQVDAERWRSKSYRLLSCADWLEYEQSPEGGPPKLSAARFCRCRLCPVCQWRRSLKMAALTRQIITEADTQYRLATGSTGFRYLLLTLTVKNVPAAQLSETIDQLHHGLNQMTRCKRWKKAVRGWIRATEVTYNAQAETFHPHIHLVLAVSPQYFKGSEYISHAEWGQLWQHYANTPYEPLTDVRAIRSADGDQKLLGAICEISKYICKPSDYLAADPARAAPVVEALDQMTHKRRFASWGGELRRVAHYLKLEDLDDAADLLHFDPDNWQRPAASWFGAYKWNASVQAYVFDGDRQGRTQAQDNADIQLAEDLRRFVTA